MNSYVQKSSVVFSRTHKMPKMKTAAQRRLKRSNSEDDYAVLSTLRRKVKLLLQEGIQKRAYIIEDVFHTKPNRFFKYINTFLKETN